MNKKELLLIKLMEECNELSQCVAKLLWFGENEVEPGQDLTNFERMVNEYNDLIGVIDKINEDDVFLKTISVYPDKTTRKKEKIEKYLIYSKGLGILDRGPELAPDTKSEEFYSIGDLFKSDQRPSDIFMLSWMGYGEDSSFLVNLIKVSGREGAGRCWTAKPLKVENVKNIPKSEFDNHFFSSSFELTKIKE